MLAHGWWIKVNEASPNSALRQFPMQSGTSFAKWKAYSSLVYQSLPTPGDDVKKKKLHGQGEKKCWDMP